MQPFITPLCENVYNLLEFIMDSLESLNFCTIGIFFLITIFLANLLVRK